MRYDVERDRTLRVEYRATTTAPTLVNLTNHSFFNLSGEDSVLGTLAVIDADAYLPVGDDLLPTGGPLPVGGSRFDFRKERAIEEHYDHNFVVPGDGLRRAARFEAGGRALEVWTTEPAIDFYTGAHLPAGFAGFAVEPEVLSDAINRGDERAVLRPGEQYEQWTEYRFSAGSLAQ